jgi:hypothetical protein
MLNTFTEADNALDSFSYLNDFLGEKLESEDEEAVDEDEEALDEDLDEALEELDEDDEWLSLD